MKKLIILLSFLPFCALAQKLPDYGFDKVRIIEADKIVQAETIPITSNPKIRTDRFYYWYAANAIQSTQGGYSGKLLNGLYTEYYLNKNLKEQGLFTRGLRNGVWKSWNEDGTLNRVANWKDGFIVVKNSTSVWKRLNIFKRKERQSVPDSLSKK